jgi:hypothetical protein
MARNFIDMTLCVDAPGGVVQHSGGQIGCQQFQVYRSVVAEGLQNEYRQRIRLLSTGTSGAPHPKNVAPVSENVRENVAF